MIVINAVILIVLAVMYGYSLKRPREWLSSADKKEHKLYALYPLADFILSITGLNRLLQQKGEIHASIRALKIAPKPEQLQRLYWCGKLSMVLIIIPIFCVLSIFAQISANDSKLLRAGRYLPRPEQGQGDREVKLTVDITDGDDDGKDKIGEAENKEGDKGYKDNEVSERTEESSRQLTLRIAERQLTQEELEEHFREAEAYLRKSVLGNNSSPDAISEDLYFCETIPDTGIRVEWEPKDIRLIQGDGTVVNEELEYSLPAEVMAVLSYGEKKTSVIMSFQIIPEHVSEKEQLDRKLAQEITETEEMTREEHELKLPDRMGQYILHWREERDASGVTVFFLGILIASGAWIAKDRELGRQMKLRREQLLIDYPEIINKFTLLVNAGMTARQAWCKISEDYYSMASGQGAKKRFAYEEMMVTAHELKLGISEGSAYEQYGRRVGLIPYIKFSSLISQNLKKGNKGFTDLLRQEALEAFENRKEMAKRLGEEAGTKLLAPMMLMLLLVFLIILVPAFISFRI